MSVKLRANRKEFRLCQEAKCLTESLKTEWSCQGHQTKMQPPTSGINGHISRRERTVQVVMEAEKSLKGISSSGR